MQKTLYIKSQKRYLRECALSPRGIVKLASLFRESQPPVDEYLFPLVATTFWQKENPNREAGVL